MLEYQRYGRNKDTLVNKTYIESGEYRRKFDNATDVPAVNKALYDCAKKALKHRSGTELEDMYWIDGDTGKVILAFIDSTETSLIRYTENIKKQIRLALKSKRKIIALHTHPHSMPPSIDDFNSCWKHGYTECYVACHNGKVFKFSSSECVSLRIYESYIQRFLNNGLSEYEAQIEALNKIKENHNIDFKEVL